MDELNIGVRATPAASQADVVRVRRTHTVVRYDSERIRIFRVFGDGDGYTVCETWSRGDVLKQLSQFGLSETIRLHLAGSGTDRWYYNLNSGQVQQRLASWRKRCTRAGLVLPTGEWK